MREARAAGVKVYVEVLCADCGQPTNRTRRAVRCYKCSRAHANGAHGAYMREHYGSTNSGRFVNPATKAKKLYEETAKNRRITTKDLLEANTQNFGPNGFAELVNRMMRREK